MYWYLQVANIRFQLLLQDFMVIAFIYILQLVGILGNEYLPYFIEHFEVLAETDSKIDLVPTNN